MKQVADQGKGDKVKGVELNHYILSIYFIHCGITATQFDIKYKKYNTSTASLFLQ